MKIDIIELFSGIGGFTKGFQEAGFEIGEHYFSEIDKHAVANYKYNYPHAKELGSVINVSGAGLRADVITFGSPCQDFSLAGKRAGMAGQRSSLISQAIRLIGEIRPDFFIWENVKGTFSSNAGADFWAIIQAFTNIGGYRLEWQLLNTSWFLPQNRERIYLVGHLADRSRPGVFPISENGGLFDKSEGANQRWTQTQNSTTLRAGGLRADDTFIQMPKIASCLTGGGHSGGLHSDMTTINTITCATQKDNLIKSGTWRTHKDGNGFRELESGLAGTLPARAREDGSGQAVVSIQNQIRRLTEIECERLQGFPDDWTKFGNYDGTIKQIPKTQRYKMCGNAVTVAVVKAIAERLKITNLPFIT